MSVGGKVGYLTYMSLSGCSGCKVFSDRVLPSLLKTLDSRINYVEIQLPSGSRMEDIAQGYETLYNQRPHIQFPMLAWSAEHPSIAQQFKYYEGNMGQLGSIQAWIKDNLPQQNYTYVPSYTVAPTPQPYASPPQAGSQVFGGMFPNKYY